LHPVKIIEIGSYKLVYIQFQKIPVARLIQLATNKSGDLPQNHSCLDNLPIYAMGLFLLHDGIHARFDSHRSKFFWEGAGPKRKYHLVNWPTICRPKEFGGLGLLNTKKMNLALLLKWIWRLYHDVDTI
jgi:hypothetical protein